MSRCRDTLRSPESAEPISGRPARGSQARTRRPCSASGSRSVSDKPVPRSHISTRSQLRSIGSDSGSRTSMSGIGGGGQITHTPARRASTSCSADAGSANRTQLKPSAASIASGSPLQSIDRGKKGRPSTSSTPRDRPAGGSTSTGAAAAAGITSGSTIAAAAAANCGGGSTPERCRSSTAISMRPGSGGASSTRCVARAASGLPGPCSSRSAGSCRVSACGMPSTASSCQRSISVLVPPGTSASTGRPVRVEIQPGSCTRTASRRSGRLARTHALTRSSSITAAGPIGVSMRSGCPGAASIVSRSQERPRCGAVADRSWAIMRPTPAAVVQVVAAVS